jgi:hypothetical protein
LGLAASPFAGYIAILADIKLSNKNKKKNIIKKIKGTYRSIRRFGSCW